MRCEFLDKEERVFRLRDWKQRVFGKQRAELNIEKLNGSSGTLEKSGLFQGMTKVSGYISQGVESQMEQER